MNLRVLCFVNNWLGWKVVEWLTSTGTSIVGLVVHPEGRRRHYDDLVAAAAIDGKDIIDGSRLGEGAVIERLRELRPDVGLSVMFGYVLRREVLDLFPRGCLNVHPAFLPYNRGADPNVWAIVDGTPAGVTIHFMDEGIDTGDIVAQRRVSVEAYDTGASLYHRLERAGLELFTEVWPQFVGGTTTRVPQDHGRATSHRRGDLEPLGRIELDGTYTGRQLIDILRARTFPPFSGASIVDQGRKIHLRLELVPEIEGDDERNLP